MKTSYHTLAKHRVVFILVVLILLAASLACNLGAGSVSSFVKPSGPKPGHWEGSQPFVSFDVTNEGQIVKFVMSAPLPPSKCVINIKSIPVSDNKFLVDAKTVNEQEASMGVFVIQGKFEGATATGTYKIQSCGRTFSLYPEEKAWKSEWMDDSALTATEAPKPTNEIIAPIATVAPTQRPAPTSSNPIYVSEFEPTIRQLGYGQYSVGKFSFSSDDPADDIHAGDPLVLGGKEYAHGIFAHAPATFVYKLGSNHYSEFSATLGLVEKISCSDGVVFYILLGGKKIYQSEVLYPWSAPVEIRFH